MISVINVRENKKKENNAQWTQHKTEKLINIERSIAPLKSDYGQTKREQTISTQKGS